MHLWRVSNHEDLQGSGGLTRQGRWHTKGKPVVYLSEHPALALLEVMVHLEIDLDDIPDPFKLLKVNVPKVNLHCKNLPQNLLPEGWHNNATFTQTIGNEWLAKSVSALLKVPSSILPSSYNYLLNPSAPESKDIEIIDIVSLREKNRPEAVLVFDD